MTHSQDKKWMSQALALAERGNLHAHPNPRVGCVIVRRGRLVAEGWHDRFGGPHAEVRALAQAGDRAKGSTLYVTLEPCPHWGKTPPCADAVARAGVARVVAAGFDPHPRYRGRGGATLRRAGVTVEAGLLAAPAQRLNPGFFSRQKKGRPFVHLKMAQSLDGKIASRTGASRWITGSAARRWVHDRRAACDAVLVGGETVRRDNPFLTAHGAGPDPLRVVLSASLDLDPRSRVFDRSAPAWVLTVPGASVSRRRRLKQAGAHLIEVPTRNGRVDVANALSALACRGVADLLVEGGGATAASFLESKTVDRVYFFVAPFFLGGRTAPTSVDGAGWDQPDKGPRLKNVRVTQMGPDILVQGDL
jgi:diaminohydroxyphosphoribosylaminopyrimidine deaminase/5-amino-6-(5-phosphoribosylamino)uracil reductase